MAGKTGTAQNHAAKVGAALSLLASGECDSKSEAADRVGIDRTSLTPARLAPVLDANPGLRAALRSNLLDITVQANGRNISLRESLSVGAEQASAKIAELTPRFNDLTKKEIGQLNRARDWLATCVKLGLFRDAVQPATPAEIAAAREEDTSTVEWYLADARRHDQSARPAAAQVLTVQPTTEPAPPEDERAA